MSPAATEVTSTKKSKPGKKKLIPIALVLLVAIGAVAYKELVHTPKSKTPVPGAIVNLPETTLNLPNGHLLQVSVALQLTQGVHLTGGEMDVLENDEIDTLSSFHYSELLTTGGKTAARMSLLRSFNSVVAGASRPAGGVGTVSATTSSTYVLDVYFTYFVMQ